MNLPSGGPDDFKEKNFHEKQPKEDQGFTGS